MSDFFISRSQAENDMLACAAFLAERIKSHEGHGEALNSVLPLYLARGEVDLAAELANAVDDPFSRDRLLIAVAEKCAEIDDDEYAIQLAESLDDQGSQARAFERIGLILARKGRSERAGEIADSMGHPDFVYAAIAESQAAAGKDADADAMIKSIEFPMARASALLQIAAVQMSEKRDNAVRHLNRAIEEAAEIEHDEERLRVFCEIGNAFVEAKANDRAIETFDTTRSFAEQLDNQHRDFFLVNCALGFLRAGSIELADRTLDLVTDKTQMASALIGFSRHYWSLGESEEAIDALEESLAIVKSQHERETRDSRARNAIITSIATQFAGFGKSERGIEIALENSDPDETVAALTQISQILTSQKEDELALQALNQIPDDASRLLALVAISDVKTKLGDQQAAGRLLSEAASMTDSVAQFASRSAVMTQIAERLALAGETGRARTMSLENLSVIGMLSDETSKAASLAALSAAHDRAGLALTEDEKRILRGFAVRF